MGRRWYFDQGDGGGVGVGVRVEGTAVDAVLLPLSLGDLLELALSRSPSYSSRLLGEQLGHNLKCPSNK